MSLQYFNNDFVKQFRQEYIVYPAVEETLYQNLLLRQFAGNHSELPVMGELLAEKFSNGGLVCRIIDKLENEDIINARRLFKFSQVLNTVFKKWMEEEPYNARTEFVTTMNNFCELARTYKNDIQEHFSGNMKKIFINPEPGVYDGVDGSFTGDLLDGIEYYLVNMQMYLEYFNITLQRENDNDNGNGNGKGKGKGIQVTTQLAEHLLKLIALIENVIVDFKYTNQMVITWEEQITNLEEQELFN